MPTGSRRSTSSYLMYYVSLVVIFFVLRAECFRWITSAYENNVFANRSSVALFRWKYVLEGADSANLDIQCGYLSSITGVQKIVVLAKKRGHVNPMRLVGHLPGSSNTQVEAYQEVIPGVGVDRSVVGFRIKLAQLSHPRKYVCKAIYSIHDTLDDLMSRMKKLVVLDPPVLLDCLKDLPSVKEGQDVEFSCYATGNPPPTLQCCLRDFFEEVLKKVPPQATIANISHQVFTEVDRAAEEIICIADGGEHTGKTNVTMPLIVHHTPRAPDSVSFVPATNQSSLNIWWPVIPNNETGGELQGYVIEYYQSSEGRISRITIRLKIENMKPIDETYTYQITGLNPDLKYTVEVFGFNKFGDGDHRKHEGVPGHIQVINSGEDEASVGVIIGGIIAGIVFIVIFVVLAVWCSTRSKKHEKFPTSHVEDAVDYPPGVGESLYANVDKNKKTSRAGSANEYPDVIHDTDMRPMVSSASYEQSNKSFV